MYILLRNGPWPAVAAWAALVLIALVGRNVLPIDETRYLSVAWEMWLRGDFLVPHENGQAYSHKPPLLFWLINASWSLLGVSEFAARLMTSLVGLANIFAVYLLGRLLWPERPARAALAPWILVTTTLWAAWSGAVMFDQLLTLCVQLALLGVVLAARGGSPLAWLLAGAGIGAGVLAKGPVVLVFTVPVMLLAPFWLRDRQTGWWSWYLGVVAAIALGAAIGLAWALPAAKAGGPAYEQALLWKQTAGRMATAAAPHARPAWWYLPFLPILFFPWIAWTPFWQRTRARFRQQFDQGERFALAVVLSGLLIFSLIRGKQVHYLLPLIPLFALFCAAMIEEVAASARAGRAWQVMLVLAFLAITAFVLTADLLPLPGDTPRGLDDPTKPWAAALVMIVVAVLFRPQWFSGLAGVGTGTVLLYLVLYGALINPMSRAHDLRPLATQVAAQQAMGNKVGFTGRKYSAQFNFMGRLKEPVEVFDVAGLERWRAENPDAALIRVVRERPADNRLYMPVWNRPRFHLWEPPTSR